MPTLDIVRAQIRPKMITEQHFLSKELAGKAQAFNLGGFAAINLKPTIANTVAVSTSFRLPDAASKKLRRGESLIEAAVAPVEDREATDALKLGFQKLGVASADNPLGVFYSLNVRRRVPDAVIGRDLGQLPLSVRKNLGDFLSIQHKIAAEQDLVLQLLPAGKKVRVVVAGKFGAFSNYMPAVIGDATPDSDEEDDPEVEEHLASDQRQDFAKCYTACLKDVARL